MTTLNTVTPPGTWVRGIEPSGHFGTFPVNIDKTLYHMTFGDWVSVSNSLLGICFAGCAYGVPGSARKLRRL